MAILSAVDIGKALPIALPIAIVTVLLSALLPSLLHFYKLSAIPVVNKEPGEWFDTKARQRIKYDARPWLEKGYREHPGKAIQLATEQGRTVFLPPEFIDSVKTDPRFSAREMLMSALKTNYPGFEGLKPITEHDEPNLFVTMLRTKLTQNLGKFTEELAEESRGAFADYFGMDRNWNEITLRDEMLKVVSRISARIFLGPELCQNKEWLQITIDYTGDVFMAARDMRQWPEWSLPVVQYFLEGCKKCRDHVKNAKRFMEPIVIKRLEELEAAQKGLAERSNDAIVWMAEVAQKKRHQAVAEAAEVQLNLSVAAVHTTTDLLTGILFDLCANPQYIEPLREEIKEVLGEHGWQKTSLYRLKLMDSVMKESQRLKPVGTAAMGRYTLGDVVLPDGTLLPRGTRVTSLAQRMWDPEYYPEPEKFIGDRFLKMRELPGKENSSQFVTTGPDHLGFGHGLHACPGRFFASNEVKIALIEILMNYDFELPEKENAKPIVLGFEMLSNPVAKLRVRRRQN